MNLISGIFKGIGYFFGSIPFLIEKKLGYFYIFPLVFWFFIWTFSFFLISLLTDLTLDWLADITSFNLIPEEGHWLSWLRNAADGTAGSLLKWVLNIFLWIMNATFLKYLTLIFLAPVLAFLSEKLEQKITGKDFPFSFSQFFYDVVRGIFISLRNMFLEYFFIVLFFFITVFFPPASIITTPLLFAVGWYFTGFSLFDYSCERQRMSIRESTVFIRKNAGFAIGIGACYAFLLALPTVAGDFIGMILGPVTGVAAATRVFLEKK